MIFDNPIFSSWYTDTVDVYRVVNVEDNHIDRQERQLVASALPCRIYDSAKNGPSMQEGTARVNAEEKLSCDVNADIQAGDELFITRGGALGITNQPERYFAGKPKRYYDPVGGAMTGLEHMEVGLLMQEIVR